MEIVTETDFNRNEWIYCYSDEVLPRENGSTIELVNEKKMTEGEHIQFNKEFKEVSKKTIKHKTSPFINVRGIIIDIWC